MRMGINGIGKYRRSWVLLVHVYAGFSKGIVNLFPPMRVLGRQVGGLRLTLPSGGQGQDRDFLPGLEAFLQFLPIRGRGKPMPARTEVLGDGSMGGEESL